MYQIMKIVIALLWVSVTTSAPPETDLTLVEYHLYTPDNLARQRFIASLLGEMGYVICQHLRFHAKARGISPKLFADNKSVQRSVDTLEKKGVLRVEILQFPRKSVLTAKFGCKILVPPDKVVDQDFR